MYNVIQKRFEDPDRGFVKNFCQKIGRVLGEGDSVLRGAGRSFLGGINSMAADTMKAMNGVIRIGVVALVFFAASGSLVYGDSAVGKIAQGKREVIKVGVVLPLTGSVSFIGENAKNALLMRVKEIPGGSKFEYKLIIEDDGFEPQRTNLAVQKLIKTDKVDVLVSNWAHGSELALPLLKNSGILHLCSDRWTVREPDYPYDFAVGAPLQENVRKFVAALKALGIHRLGLFMMADQGSILYRKTLEETLKNESNIKIVEPLTYNPNERDFRVWILRLREANPDALLCDGARPAQEIMLRQMKQLSYNVLFCSQSSVWLDGSKGHNEGSWFVAPPIVEGLVAENFRKAYGREAQYPAAHYYDLLSLLIDACEKLPADRKPTAAEISRKLREIKSYPEALGLTSYVPPNKLATTVDYFFIENGNPRKVSLEELKKLKGNK